MKISTKGRYGLRAMIDLAANGTDKLVTLKSIAERQSLSEPYLEQLIAPLKKAGLVRSTRGAFGGYALTRAPDAITVGDVLRVLEGDMMPVDCESENACAAGACDNCVTKSVWGKMYDSMNDVIDNITLSELASDYKGVTESENLF